MTSPRLGIAGKRSEMQDNRGMPDTKPAVVSQTLSRGIQALEVLAEAESGLSIPQLAARLNLHRSIAYRIVRTLEQHGLVLRRSSGEIELGPGLAALARNVARDLQTAALPELTDVANELGMTAFIAVSDGQGSAVTLVSVEPRHAVAAVAQRPGSSHSIDIGAPGRAIRRQLDGVAGGLPYETSHDEVIDGLSSVAAPLVVPRQSPGSLAVVYLSRPVDVEAIGARLVKAAQVIRRELA